jgi:hypothetical protein
MDLPAPLSTFLRDNSTTLLGLLLLLTVFLLFGFLFVASRLARLTRLYRRLTQGTSGGNIEEVLHEFMGTVNTVSDKMTSMEGRVQSLSATQQRCLQKVGVVRYDAFEDIGGQQSFAVVILDAERSGVALSSVYSRTDVRVYSKEIRKGQPTHALTREEEQAMALAEGGR